MNKSAGNFKQLLQRKAFRCLWLGIMFSRIGDAFTTVALSWFVLQIAGPSAVGLVLLCFGIPRFVSSPIAGVLLDRYQPRVVMAIDNLGRALLIASIPVLNWFGILSIWYICIVGLVAGFLSSATVVGENTVVPQLVADEELENANTLLSANWQVASLLGPVVAGFLVGAVSASTTILIDALSFLIMGIVAISLPRLRLEKRNLRKLPLLKETFYGFRLLGQMRLVGFMVVTTSIVLLSSGTFEVLFPTYCQRILNTNALGYGILISGMGLGSLLGYFLIMSFVKKYPPGLSLATILVAEGLLLLPLSLTNKLPLAVFLVFAVGFVSSPYYVLDRTIMQRLIPEHLRGRVFGAVGSIRAGGFPIGAAIGGFLLAHLSISFVILLTVMIEVLLGIVVFLVPAMRNLTNSVQSSKRLELNA